MKCKEARGPEERREGPSLRRADLRKEQCMDKIYRFAVVGYREPQRTRVETQPERE